MTTSQPSPPLPPSPVAVPTGSAPPDRHPAGRRTRRAGLLRRRRGSLAHHHDFRQLWLGDTVSQVGTQLSVLAIPVLAVRTLDADELQMGLLAAFETLAFLVVGLPAGAWVDRWRKKRVLVTGDLLRAVALATLPAAWLMNALTLPHLYAVALAVGVCTVFFDVAYQSYLPEIVPSNRISEGNSKLQASQSVAQVAGPAAGGFLIRAVGAPLTVGLDAVSFLGSALFVRRISQPDTPPREGRRSLVVEIREGLAFVLHHRLLLRITACTAIGNLFGAMSSALLVLFALRDLGLTEAILGVVFAVGAVGGLLGALVVGGVTRLVGEGRAIPLSALAWAPGAVLVPLAGPLPATPTLVVSMFVFSFCVVVYNVTQVSFRQRVCPRPLLGRMNASVRFIVWGCQPVGAAAGGVLGQLLGVRPTLWVAAGGSLLAALPVVLSPLIGMRDLPSELDQHA